MKYDLLISFRMTHTLLHKSRQASRILTKLTIYTDWQVLMPFDIQWLFLRYPSSKSFSTITYISVCVHLKVHIYQRRLKSKFEMNAFLKHIN